MNATVFQQLCVSSGIPMPVAEHRFHPVRRWRFDWAWPDHMVALEVEGGIWVKGAHTRGGHFLSDADKYNTATIMGWKVLRCIPKTLLTRATMELLKSAIHFDHAREEHHPDIEGRKTEDIPGGTGEGGEI